jgi:antagonist of KipI
LQVIKSGTPVTVQDLGRWGFQSQGVPVAGPMDEDAFVQANLLVGNDLTDACLEIFSGPSEWSVTQDSLIALTGKGVNLIVQDRAVPANRSLWIKSGTTLKMKPTAHGSWSYLAIGGGVRADVIMNSRATYLPAGFGGLDGSMLKAGDRLDPGQPSALTGRLEVLLARTASPYNPSRWGIAEANLSASNTIRIMAGPEWHWMSEAGQQRLTQAGFSVSPDSSRMGYRLNGPRLERSMDGEMLSSAVSKGTVQLTNDGALVVLMADGQTVGGYPRVGQVAAVDLPRLAQRRVGEHISFTVISVTEAEQLFLDRARERRQIRQAIKLKIQSE